MRAWAQKEFDTFLGTNQIFTPLSIDKQTLVAPGWKGGVEWGGEHEDSSQARAALAKPLPYVLALMVFIVVCLFNSLRSTLLIWLIMPLAIIGATFGLLVMREPFGFMALLGMLSMGGELIKMQIVVLSKIVDQVKAGVAPYQAILSGGTANVDTRSPAKRAALHPCELNSATTRRMLSRWSCESAKMPTFIWTGVRFQESGVREGRRTPKISCRSIPSASS